MMPVSEIRSPINSASPRDKLLTTPEVAEMLRISVRKVNAMMSAGSLPRVKIGRATRIPLSDAMRIVRGGSQ